jgi:hypothetical protein
MAEKMDLDQDLGRPGSKIAMIVSFVFCSRLFSSLSPPLGGEHAKKLSVVGRFLKEQAYLMSHSGNGRKSLALRRRL